MSIYQDARRPLGLKDLSIRNFAAMFHRVSVLAIRLHPTKGCAVKRSNHTAAGVDTARQMLLGPGLRRFYPISVVVSLHVTPGRSLSLQQGMTNGGSGGYSQGPAQLPSLEHDVPVELK